MNLDCNHKHILSAAFLQSNTEVLLICTAGYFIAVILRNTTIKGTAGGAVRGTSELPKCPYNITCWPSMCTGKHTTPSNHNQQKAQTEQSPGSSGASITDSGEPVGGILL